MTIWRRDEQACGGKATHRRCVCHRWRRWVSQLQDISTALISHLVSWRSRLVQNILAGESFPPQTRMDLSVAYLAAWQAGAQLSVAGGRRRRMRATPKSASPSHLQRFNSERAIQLFSCLAFEHLSRTLLFANAVGSSSNWLSLCARSNLQKVYFCIGFLSCLESQRLNLHLSSRIFL